MHIKLRCSKCDLATDFSFSELFELWKKGFQELNISTPGKNIKVSLSADTSCACGGEETYNSPLFQHIFQTIFNVGMKNFKN